MTVFGATGLQGGSVALTFLTDPKLSSDWSVRAVTRDINKDSSKSLAAQGAEVVAVSAHPVHDTIREAFHLTSGQIGRHE